MLKKTAVVLTAAMTLGVGVASADQQTKQVQAKLGIPADGVMGPQTKRAIKRFQRRNGLVVDGIIGPQTLAALGLEATASSSSALERIAQCESGGDPTAISSGGTYRGKYQFKRSTWRAYGGTGDPAAASEATQDRIAAKLFAAEGTAPWPVCGANA